MLAVCYVLKSVCCGLGVISYCSSLCLMPALARKEGDAKGTALDTKKADKWLFHSLRFTPPVKSGAVPATCRKFLSCCIDRNKLGGLLALKGEKARQRAAVSTKRLVSRGFAFEQPSIDHPLQFCKEKRDIHYGKNFSYAHVSRCPARIFSPVLPGKNNLLFFSFL